MAINMKTVLTLLKNYLLRLLAVVAVTFVISYIICYFIDFNIGTTLIVLGLVFMIMGLSGLTNAKSRESVNDTYRSDRYIFLSAPAGIVLFIIGLFLAD